MPNSTLITDYVGRGLLSARPTTPNIPAGATAFYYATDVAILYEWSGSAWGTISPYPAPILRGTGIQASSAASYNVNWPAGTVAGDLAIVFVGGGFTTSAAPSGWTTVDSQSGSNWNGEIYAKVLSSGDISTGFVTINMASGAFDTVLAIATFAGATAGIAGLVAQRNGSGSGSITLTTPSPYVGAQYLFFSSNRAASTNTISQGTSKQTANDGSAASGALYYGPLSGINLGSVTYTYGTAGVGNYQAQLAVIGP